MYRLATIHFVTDRLTDRQTDRRHYDDTSRWYCVAVGAKQLPILKISLQAPYYDDDDDDE